MRVILITGANGDLGHGIAQHFLQQSAEDFVWLGVRTHRERALNLKAQYPDRCECIDLEVTSAKNWEQVVNSILQQSKQLDVLVNNAGKHHDGLLATLPVEAWRDVLDSNLDGVFHGCRTVIPTMISQRHGRIINISSLSAILAPAGQTNYAAAKAGVVALTQSLAKEVARLGITVNAICPGYIETEILKKMTEAEQQAARSKVPMRRFGRPEEVAVAVRFLACPEASYITGSVLKIDGGIF